MSECPVEQELSQNDGERVDSNDTSGVFSDAFGGLVEIINNIRDSRHKVAQNTNQTLYQDSESEDDSGDASGEEDQQVQTQQTQPIEDLQAELARFEINEEASVLESLILIVEHYVKTGDIDGFMENVRRPDMWLMKSPRPSVTDLTGMAENLEKQEQPFRAVLMRKCLCALYKYEYDREPGECTSDAISPDDAVNGIEENTGKVFDIFCSIFNKEDCEIYLSHFLSVMYDMLTNLREIHHADRRNKADREAWCILYITLVHGRLGEIVEMFDVAETNVKTMERRFKTKVQSHLVYGPSLFALSLAKSFSGDFTELEEIAKQAVKALQEAKGLTGWDDKVKLVAKAEKLSQNIR